jgi:hypothetical protein
MARDFDAAQQPLLTTRVTGDPPQAIQWSRDDRLCLDGKRLVKLPDGTYRTEIDQFSKIVVDTSDFDGNPLSFSLGGLVVAGWRPIAATRHAQQGRYFTAVFEGGMIAWLLR